MGERRVEVGILDDAKREDVKREDVKRTKKG
jgi:hypothetical protein